MTPQTTKPHILIFNPDQWRGDVLGHIGNPAAVTPNLDKMIQTDAVSFRNAFCQNPVCTPSRCSFMTGWYPHVRGHRTMFHMLQKDEPVLLRTLKDNGYFTWWGGKNDLTPAQDSLDEFCNIKYKPPAPPLPMWMIDREAEWRGSPSGDLFYSFYFGKLPTLKSEFYPDGDWANVLGAVNFIKTAPKDTPLCIYLPLTYPHPPYAVEEPWYSLINRDLLPPRIPPIKEWKGKPSILNGIWENQHLQTWDEPRWSELRAVYYGMCARVDHQFGLIVNALKEAGLYDDTAIFFFSDHGDFTGDYGLVEKTQNTFEDCLVRVPFIIKPHRNIDVKPRVCDAMVELIDFPATVEEITNIRPKHTHFGRSLISLITGETESHRDAVFAEGGRLPEETHCKELESKSHQVPAGLYYPRLSLQIKDGPEHTKATMIRTKRFKYVRRLLEKDEFYNLQTDPKELNNLIENLEYQHDISNLKERMLTFYLETSDVVPFQTDRRG
jgi:arylsulfatase A-like enzyme